MVHDIRLFAQKKISHLDEGSPQFANSHAVVEVIREIKMARNWLGRICVCLFLHLVGDCETVHAIFSHSVQVMK